MVVGRLFSVEAQITSNEQFLPDVQLPDDLAADEPAFRSIAIESNLRPYVMTFSALREAPALGQLAQGCGTGHELPQERTKAVTVLVLPARNGTIPGLANLRLPRYVAREANRRGQRVSPISHSELRPAAKLSPALERSEPR
jgi:hypothetical protein